jgi:hypothetical protein
LEAVVAEAVLVEVAEELEEVYTLQAADILDMVYFQIILNIV